MERLTRSRDVLAVLAGLLGPFAVCLALVPFRTSVANTNAALVLVVVVVAVAANGNRLAGILAAGSAAVWFDFFLTQPYERFSISGRNDVETAVLLLVVGAAVSELAARGRRNRTIAITDETYLSGIQKVAELVSSGAEALDVVREVSRQLVTLLDLRSCRFEYGSFLGNPPRLDTDGELRVNGVVVDVLTTGFPATEVELLVRGGRATHGRFLLTPKPGTTATLGARRVAVIFATQAGAALSQGAATRR